MKIKLSFLFGFLCFFGILPTYGQGMFERISEIWPNLEWYGGANDVLWDDSSETTYYNGGGATVHFNVCKDSMVHPDDLMYAICNAMKVRPGSVGITDLGSYRMRISVCVNGPGIYVLGKDYAIVREYGDNRTLTGFS